MNYLSPIVKIQRSTKRFEGGKNSITRQNNQITEVQIFGRQKPVSLFFHCHESKPSLLALFAPLVDMSIRTYGHRSWMVYLQVALFIQALFIQLSSQTTNRIHWQFKMS